MREPVGELTAQAWIGEKLPVAVALVAQDERIDECVLDVHERSVARKNVEDCPPLVFDFGQGDLVGGDVDDFAVFPENHGDAGTAVFEDGFAEGTVASGPYSSKKFRKPASNRRAAHDSARD